MNKVRIGINGCGRIGRTLVREWLSGCQNDLDIVAINNPGKIETYAHLLQYDSVHGRCSEKITTEESCFLVGPHKIKYFSMRDPAEIPWGEANVDVVLDATGKFKDRASLKGHLQGSVKKVILCCPGKDVDHTIVMGVNERTYQPESHHIISNASCTTNALAPVIKVLHEHFAVENGFMVTVHSYTSDQNLLDGSHKDLRRARAAAYSMIPTSTGAAKSLGVVIPDLKGKIDGYAIRVPTPNVSLIDLNVLVLRKDVTKQHVQNVLFEASRTTLKGYMDVTKEELVSTDYLGLKASTMVDSSLISTMNQMIKVVTWYDNEVGFSCRVLDLARYIQK
jgi:glyceraldehyde-3-phosphate dehydrogenase type I